MAYQDPPSPLLPQAKDFGQETTTSLLVWKSAAAVSAVRFAICFHGWILALREG